MDDSSPSNAEQRLREINREIAEKRAADEAGRAADRGLRARRSEYQDAAASTLGPILERLVSRIRSAAPSAAIGDQDGFSVRLGDGRLQVDPVRHALMNVLQAFDYEAPFDVVAYTAIHARKPRDSYDYEGRSHSLWYCDAYEEGEYHWFELAFMVQPLVAERYTVDPFALPPTDTDAAKCLTPVMTVRQVARAPLPIDSPEAEASFIERWLGWLAQAADGTLSHPSAMPEDTGGWWRFDQSRRVQ